MPGGNGGSPFSDDLGHKVLKRVCLQVGSSTLYSIQSVYTDKSTGTKHGGNRGISHWFDLDGDEKIIAVLLWADTNVKAIQFQTNNGRVSQKYGLGRGAPFVLRQERDGKTQVVAGFSGRAGKQIDQLDIIWSDGISSKLRYMKTTERRGITDTEIAREPGENEVENKFDDMLSLENPKSAAISRIVVRYGCLIDSIKVYYALDNTECPAHGGVGGCRDEFTLESDEFIKKIEGRSHSRIVQLTFVTNKRRWGPYGGTEGELFIWDAGEGVPAHLASQMGLLSFSGISGRYLDQLQATFAEYPRVQDNLGCVKYEGYTNVRPPHGTQTGNDDTISVIPSRAPGQTETAFPLSEFTLHLMAPIITLHAGPEKTEFHAYKDTLCQLPFFRAALQGQFKEALEGAICMPEDDPSQVSALVEFLYTGNYTYAYKVKGVRPQEELNDPVGDLIEGLFHLSVYAIAAKFNCQRLIDITLKSLKTVLDVLDEIDTLRLWKAAYAKGMRIPDQKSDTGQDSYDEKLILWVSQLFQNHREEVERTMSECPELSCDLLRLATTGYWN